MENPHVQLQRVSSEDCRTQVRGQDSEAECRFSVFLACSQRRCGESPHVKLRQYHQKTTEHQFVDRQCSRVLRIQSALEFLHNSTQETKSTFRRQSSIDSGEIAPPCTRCSAHRLGHEKILVRRARVRDDSASAGCLR